MNEYKWNLFKRMINASNRQGWSQGRWIKMQSKWRAVMARK